MKFTTPRVHGKRRQKDPLKPSPRLKRSRDTWYVSFEPKDEHRQRARLTASFLNEQEAKEFAIAKLSEGINVCAAGTLNPHEPKRIIVPAQIVDWVHEPETNAAGLDEGAKAMLKCSTFPSLSIRIDLAEGRIGPGKIRLLETVRHCGSLAAASRLMGMSLHRALGLIKEIETIYAVSAVQRHVGGKSGGGTTLTPFGLSLVESYREIERQVESVTREELLALQAEIATSHDVLNMES